VSVRRLQSICRDFGCSRQLRAAPAVVTAPEAFLSVTQWMMTMLYLSDAEIADLCAPLTQPAAQVRYLRALGLTVAVKPNGRPVVIRCHAEIVLSSGAAGGGGRTSKEPLNVAQPSQPSRANLITLLQRGRNHGKTKSAQPTESPSARLR
jgi:Domain of unknown function (DUF4224)